MRGKVLICFILLIASIGIVSADTAIIYTTNTTDGNVYTNTHNSTWSDVHNSGGSAVSTTTRGQPYLGADLETGKFYRLYRAINIYDTSILPDDAIISSADIGLYWYTTGSSLGDTGVGITKFNIDGTISSDDFNNFDYTRLSTDKNISTLTSAQYYNWSLNSLGILNISKTGSSGFGVLLGWDIDDSPPTWLSGSKSSSFYFVSAEYVTNTPFIQVVYTIPDTTPPASITNLANTTNCNSINWSWTNPADADFDLVQVYQNGTFLHNVTTAYDNWTGLIELTDYEIATHTCDATGNCNTTFVNATFTTISCSAAVIPVASFISNATCGNVPFAVQFNDTSLNIPTSWNWSFGDGNFSEDQNSLFIYNSSGLFSINFNATNDAGTGWSNRTNYIRAVPDWYSCPVIITPTPWQPEIMPSTEFDARLDNLIPYWWIPAILLVGWILFRRF